MMVEGLGADNSKAHQREIFAVHEELICKQESWLTASVHAFKLLVAER